MTSILLYWNHICVLHRQEKAFLEDLAQRLRGDGIRLEVRYFGLGYPERMSEYLARRTPYFRTSSFPPIWRCLRICGSSPNSSRISIRRLTGSRCGRAPC